MSPPPESFNRIAYRRLGICNPLNWDSLEAAVVAAGWAPGARIADLGSGNGRVAAWLAQRGLAVEAVERDPAMADLAEELTAGSAIRLHRREALSVLEEMPPFDGLVALGTTALAPAEGGFAGLARHLAPGGTLIWGDLAWRTQPSAPLAALLGPGDWRTDAGWREAAKAAGLATVFAHEATEAEWQAYVEAIRSAVTDWITAHPDRAEVPRLRARLQLVEAAWTGEARQALAFWLYAFRRAP